MSLPPLCARWTPGLRYWSRQGTFGLVAGILTATICALLAVLVNRKKVGPKPKKVAAFVLLALWLSAACVLTFDGPFNRTGAPIKPARGGDGVGEGGGAYGAAASYACRSNRRCGRLSHRCRRSPCKRNPPQPTATHHCATGNGYFGTLFATFCALSFAYEEMMGTQMPLAAGVRRSFKFTSMEEESASTETAPQASIGNISNVA